MTDRTKPRGEMLMDIGAQAVKAERARSAKLYLRMVEHQDTAQELCREYIETQKLA